MDGWDRAEGDRIDPVGDRMEEGYEDRAADDPANGPFPNWPDHPDPHEFDFIPGYPTEMDYMNAMEADDYTHEFDDLDGE